MKVYVWEDVLTDWTSGMIVIVASSDAQAAKKLGEMFGGHKDDRIEGLVFEGKEPEIVNVHRGDSPQGWFVYGGG